MYYGTVFASVHWATGNFYTQNELNALQIAIDLEAEAEAAKAEPKNIRAEASRISVEPKLQNV